MVEPTTIAIMMIITSACYLFGGIFQKNADEIRHCSLLSNLWIIACLFVQVIIAVSA